MTKLSTLGYAAMVLALIISTLYLYGFIPMDPLSLTLSLTPVWIWGLTAIFLLWTREMDGLLLATGFITFTIFVSLILFFTSYIAR